MILTGCARQLRRRLVPVPAGMGFVTIDQVDGLDFGAVMAVAAARGADLAMLSEVLPGVEMAIVAAHRGGDEEEE